MEGVTDERGQREQSVGEEMEWKKEEGVARRGEKGHKVWTGGGDTRRGG